MRKLSLLAVALLCLCSCTFGAEETFDTGQYDSQLLQPGAEAPDFTITNAQYPGGLKLSQLRGSYVVLEFWASWCPDCRKATPAMVEMHSEYSPRGVEFVGVSFDTDSAAWQRYIESSGMDWIHYSELKKWEGRHDARRAIPRELDSHRLPHRPRGQDCRRLHQHRQDKSRAGLAAAA